LAEVSSADALTVIVCFARTRIRANSVLIASTSRAVIICSNVSSEEKVQRRTLFYFKKNRHSSSAAGDLISRSTSRVASAASPPSARICTVEPSGACAQRKTQPGRRKILAVREGSSCGEVMRQISWNLGAVVGRLFNASS
jgi:hypothetical protein